MNEFNQVFLPVFGAGAVIGVVLAWRAARTVRHVAAAGLLLLGTLVVWFSLAAGVHYGYGAWQGIENPPDEAFVDGAELVGSVMFGWLPAGMLCLLVFLFDRHLHRRPLPPPLPRDR